MKLLFEKSAINQDLKQKIFHKKLVQSQREKNIERFEIKSDNNF